MKGLVNLNAVDLTGQIFGKLHVIKRTHNYVSPNGQIRSNWICKCECGNYTIVTGDKLKSGNTKSCGCLRTEYNIKKNYRHGLRKTRIYRIYYAMKNRCENHKAINYHSYGGRNICVCEEWSGEHGFENFYEWSMRNGYNENLTIDRKNVHGNYCPENCKWSNVTEQMNNKTNSHFITVGNDTHTLTEWSRISGISVSTICQRIKSGVPEQVAIFQKLYTRKRGL